MTTIIINVEEPREASKIFEALHLLKNIKSISLISDDDTQTDIMEEMEKEIKKGNKKRK